MPSGAAIATERGGLGGSRIVGGEAYAPDAVQWACFHQDAVASAQEVVAEFIVLAELRLAGFCDNRHTAVPPCPLVEVADPAAQVFGAARMGGGDDGGGRFVVTEEAGPDGNG